MLSAMPEEDDTTFGVSAEAPADDSTAEDAAPAAAPAASAAADPFVGAQFSAKTIQGAYDSRFGDLGALDSEHKD